MLRAAEALANGVPCVTPEREELTETKHLFQAQRTLLTLYPSDERYGDSLHEIQVYGRMAVVKHTATGKIRVHRI